MRCSLALLALYKMHLSETVYQLNGDGHVVKGERILHWKVLRVAPAEDIVKLRYLALKELYKLHRKGKHWLNSFPKP